MNLRPVTFEEAKARYPHRYTMEHIPDWVKETPRPKDNDGTADWYYAPPYRSDQEWYDNTLFPGEGHVDKNSKHCYSFNQSWPLGRTLPEPFTR